MTTVAVVGLGAMGGRVAGRLLAAGYKVVVWNRTAARMAELADAGAAPAASPADAAVRADVVLTMVRDASALESVTEGPAGIGAGVDGATTLIEMSTVGPAAVARLESALPNATPLLDAPVLGSVGEAEAGTLTIFVGGPAPLVERWTPLLSELGSPIPVGGLGAGAAAKLVANTTLFGTLAILGEALALSDSLGLAREAAWRVLADTPLAAQVERRRQAVESGEYPVRFRLSLARKDADLIAEAAGAASVEFRVTSAARAWLEEAEHAGWGERDYAAVLAWILGCDGERRL